MKDTLNLPVENRYKVKGIGHSSLHPEKGTSHSFEYLCQGKIFKSKIVNLYMDQLSAYINDINRLCSVHGVRYLYAFGSILTDKYGDQSDIDLIVDLFPISTADYADNYYGLKFSLEKVFNRKVDLLEEKAIKNPYFLESVNNKKRVLYGN
jgi:predicted nucleotidyltransferase